MSIAFLDYDSLCCTLLRPHPLAVDMSAFPFRSVCLHCACYICVCVCVCVWCPNLKYPMTFKVGLPICLFTIGIEFPTMGKSFSSKPYDPSEGAWGPILNLTLFVYVSRGGLGYELSFHLFNNFFLSFSHVSLSLSPDFLQTPTHTISSPFYILPLVSLQ